MTIQHERAGVVYQRTSVDIPADVKADVDKYGINVTQTSVEALKKAVELKKVGVPA
jgi:hypothetical protein